MLRMAMQPDNNDSIHNTFAIYKLQNVMIIVGLQLLLFSSLSQFSLVVNLLYVMKNIFIKIRKFTSKNRGHKTAMCIPPRAVYIPRFYNFCFSL